MALEALRRASVTVREDCPHLSAMATAVVALAVGDALHVVHAGDVRAYLMSDGELVQVTQDDSLINTYRALAPDTPEEELARLPKNVITEALGLDHERRDRVATFPLREGATVLIASDGLHEVVGQAEIERALVEATHPVEACSRLAQMAEAANSRDNVSVLVARVERVQQARVMEP